MTEARAAVRDIDTKAGHLLVAVSLTGVTVAAIVVGVLSRPAPLPNVAVWLVSILSTVFILTTAIAMATAYSLFAARGAMKGRSLFFALKAHSTYPRTPEFLAAFAMASATDMVDDCLIQTHEVYAIYATKVRLLNRAVMAFGVSLVSWVALLIVSIATLPFA